MESLSKRKKVVRTDVRYFLLGRKLREREKRKTPTAQPHLQFFTLDESETCHNAAGESAALLPILLQGGSKLISIQRRGRIGTAPLPPPLRYRRHERLYQMVSVKYYIDLPITVTIILSRII